jgi:hypothetical protein
VCEVGGLLISEGSEVEAWLAGGKDLQVQSQELTTRAVHDQFLRWLLS